MSMKPSSYPTSRHRELIVILLVVTLVFLFSTGRLVAQETLLVSILAGKEDKMIVADRSGFPVPSSAEKDPYQQQASLSHKRRRLNQTKYLLENPPWRFYMYNESSITQSGKNNKLKRRIRKRYEDEIEYDLKVLRLFNKSNLRTEDPKEADIFVVPTPIGECIASTKLDEHEAIEALLNHSIFQSVAGNRHLLISTAFVTFRSDTKKWIKQLSRHYADLKNVTVASSHDAALNKVACCSFRSFIKNYEFYGPELKAENCDAQDQFRDAPVDRYASIGLGDARDDVPIIKPTMEKFYNASYFIFYRTRTTPGFVNNSTIYRHLAIENMTLEGFPESKFGYPESNRSQWLNEYLNSQFCLVLRGDSPNSHALIRSLRVGCLPVIISDTYPIFNPALQSSLEMDDFAFFIPEQDFLRDPRGELLKLAKLSNQTILEKIEGAQLAQRILLPDHPQSLLVPALIKEVLATNDDGYTHRALERARALLVRNHIIPSSPPLSLTTS